MYKKIKLKLNKDKRAQLLKKSNQNDYIIIDSDKILYRVVIPENVKDGDLCNVYCGTSTKYGLFIDSTKSIIEQLKELKKQFLQEHKIRCNNCMRYYSDEEELLLLYSDKTDEFFRACPHCKTDAYLTDTDYLLKEA